LIDEGGHNLKRREGLLAERSTRSGASGCPGSTLDDCKLIVKLNKRFRATWESICTPPLLFLFFCVCSMFSACVEKPELVGQPVGNAPVRLCAMGVLEALPFRERERDEVLPFREGEFIRGKILETHQTSDVSKRATINSF
jgi:hypothetical protein